MDDQHPARYGFNFLEKMRGKQNRLLPTDLLQGRADFANLVRIQSAGGFIQNQNLRLVQHRLRQTDALPVAARELGNPLTGYLLQAAQLDDRRNALAPAREAHPAGLAEKLQQVIRGHVQIQRPILGQVADFLSRGQAVLGDVDARHAHVTFAGREKSGEDLQNRRFARPVGTQHGHDFAGAHGERHVPDGDKLAVVLRQPSGLNHYRVGRHRLPLRKCRD